MIHPQAIIDPSAKLAEGVEVGPWSYIGPDVEIGANTRIESHVVVKGPTKIGSGIFFNSHQLAKIVRIKSMPVNPLS